MRKETENTPLVMAGIILTVTYITMVALPVVLENYWLLLTLPGYILLGIIIVNTPKTRRVFEVEEGDNMIVIFCWILLPYMWAILIVLSPFSAKMRSGLAEEWGELKRNW